MSHYPTWFRAFGLSFVLLFGFVALTTGRRLLNLIYGKKSKPFVDRVQMNWCRSVCRFLNVRINAQGIPHEAPGMLVCNHVSWLDILILGGIQPITFVAKSEIAEWPLLGPMARDAGTLFIHRGNSSQTRVVAERMAWTLRQGRTLGLFPEGTTTTGKTVLKFHSRLFQAACLNGVTVQALALQYRGVSASLAPFVGDDALVPHIWRLLQLPTIDVKLTFCEPIAANQMPRDELAEYTRNQILEALGIERMAEGVANAHGTSTQASQI